jgi:predicted GIY-YIG superfamily endonuclease
MAARTRSKPARKRSRPRAALGRARAAGGDWLVYMLRCRDGSLYTGITNNLDRRLAAHAAGTASKYTRSRLPVKLVYRERQAGRSLALKREAAIKRLDRRRKEQLITSGRGTVRQAARPVTLDGAARRA